MVHQIRISHTMTNKSHQKHPSSKKKAKVPKIPVKTTPDAPENPNDIVTMPSGSHSFKVSLQQLLSSASKHRHSASPHAHYASLAHANMNIADGNGRDDLARQMFEYMIYRGCLDANIQTKMEWVMSGTAQESASGSQFQHQILTRIVTIPDLRTLFSTLFFFSHSHSPPPPTAISIPEFYLHYWEKRPLIIKRKSPSYYASLLPLSHLRNIIHSSPMQYTEDLDVTIYKNKKRQTLNPEGKVDPQWVWEKFEKKGCSVRLNYPQEHSDSVWQFCSQLENWFGMGVSSNCYLTPANSGGFAPHYDDVDVFLLQTEGAKQWKLYVDSQSAMDLARDSSPNFHEKDIGEASHEFVLEQGDLLYMPRGTIHMGRSLGESPSLHLTVSTGLKNTWYDFITETLQSALEVAHQEDREFRQSMPRFFHSYMGVSNVETGNKVSRHNFEAYYRYLLSKMAKYAPLDAAADVLAEKFLHDRLPPASCGNPEEQIMPLRKEIKANTQLVLTAPNVCRVVNGDLEEETLYLLFCSRNSRRYHDKPNQFLECELGLAPALEKLIHAYPQKLSVQDLYDALIFDGSKDVKKEDLEKMFRDSLHAVLQAMYEEKVLRVYFAK